MPEQKANKLINEKSPYLLQHAYNPVDWHPWSEESFEKARKEDKPIFLSIGYSTCYWCHVMEREVFENEKLAKVMNELFVNIKVDREERPDVDRVYMSALQSLTGSGGWPMSMFLTTELKPFYGATYIPPEEKYGQPGFLDLITGINDAWTNRRDEITKAGNDLTEYLKKITSGKKGKSDLNESILTKGYENYIQTFDEVYGGFGKAPKFPRPVAFNFLLRYYNHYKTQSAHDMVSFTLEKMVKGGDYDHLGGGFHRYSVDKFWRVPHFEKMLYDQAQLVNSFLETYQITHDEFFANYAKDILSYVNRCLTDKQTGGFFSAEDAESALLLENPNEKEEGAFYVWEKKEIEDLLEKEDAEIISYYFGIEDEGNTPIGSDPHSVFINKNILYIAHSISETANHFNKSTDEVYTIIEESKRILFDVREKRPLCHLDDKVLVSWNALMISAYAKAYQVFYKTEYLESAKRSADFILNKLYDESAHTLKHRYRDGDSRFEGTLEDYSYFIQSLLDLYESDFDEKYLSIAVKLTDRIIELFYDSEYSGFFDISDNDKSILIRTKEDYDSAEPTGNSIAILNLLRLSHITENKNYFDKAEKSLEYFSTQMSQHPYGMPQMLVALDYYLHKPKQIVIAGTDSNSIQEFAREVHRRFIPNKVLIGVNKNSDYKHADLLTSLSKNIKQTTAFVCENYTCNLPVNNINEFTKQIND